ncbi:hypothetical protein VPH35_077192 [Triticum aestivum]
MEGLRDDESISDDIRRESIETANRFPVSAFLTVYVTLAVFRSRRDSSHKILKFVGFAAASWQDGHKAAVASRHRKATDRISTQETRSDRRRKGTQPEVLMIIAHGVTK